jgi:predicted kinase
VHIDVTGLAELIRSRPPVGPVRLVTVDGFSGAGKTELADRLGAALAAPVVHLDDIYPGWDGLAAAVPLAVRWIAEPLSRGRPARWRRYDWAAGRFAEWHDVPPAPVVVLEGCGAGAAALRPYAATAIWVEVPPEQREARLRGRPDWPGYAAHRARWAAQEDALLTPEHADVVVHNTTAGTGDAAEVPRRLSDPDGRMDAWDR